MAVPRVSTIAAIASLFAAGISVAGCLSDNALEIACTSDDECVDVCVRGVCLTAREADEGCGVGLRWCDGACLDVTSSVDRCGACDIACTAGPWQVAACVDESCTTTCTDEAAIDDDGTCVAPCVPSDDGIERCNGRDDDCDGLTDEADLVMPACGRFGVCAAIPRACVDGVERCDEDTLASDPLWSAFETRCDDVDNDCDGDVDEGCCPDADWVELAAGPHRILDIGFDGERARASVLVVEADGRLQRANFEGDSVVNLVPTGEPAAVCPTGQRAVRVTAIDGAIGESLSACTGDGGISLVRTDSTGVHGTAWPIDRIPTGLSAAADDRGLVLAMAADDGAVLARIDGVGVAPRDLTTTALPPDAIPVVRVLDGTPVVAAASADARRLVWIEAVSGGRIASVEVVTAVATRPALVNTIPPTVAVVDALGVLRVWQQELVNDEVQLTPLGATDADTIDDRADVAPTGDDEIAVATSTTGVTVPATSQRDGLDVRVDVGDVRVLDLRAVLVDDEIEILIAGPDGLLAGRFDASGIRRCDP